MWLVAKYAFYVVIACGLGVVGYAIFSDLPAPERDITVEITPPGSAQ